MIKGVFGFLKSLFFGESDQQMATDDAQSLKQRTLQAVASDQHDLVHKGPRGGLYRLDANGRKIYSVKAPRPLASHAEPGAVGTIPPRRPDSLRRVVHWRGVTLTSSPSRGVGLGICFNERS